jgi:hypothetical protein
MNGIESSEATQVLLHVYVCLWYYVDLHAEEFLFHRYLISDIPVVLQV